MTLRLYSLVHRISETTLVVSHQGSSRTIWRFVEAVRFCRVKQLLFPHVGAYRGAAALKLHFTWAIAHTFEQLVAEEVVYMEDDFWVSK